MTIRTIRSILLLSLFWLGVLPSAVGASASGDPWAKIAREPLDELAGTGRAVVMVRLKTAGDGEPALAGADPAARRAAVSRARGAVRAGMAQTPGWRERASLELVPWMLVEVDHAALGRLASLPEVERITGGARVQPATAQSRAVIGADRAATQHGLDGTGAVVGVIDTGIDLTHPDLAGAVVAARAFINNGGESTDVSDELGHGSYVAGIIAGRGMVSPPGVAPGAGLVVVKALTAEGGYIFDLARGLEWIVLQNETLQRPVRFVNLSLLIDGDLPADCPCDNLPDEELAPLTEMIEVAWARGVTCIAAAGNDGEPVLRYPACLSRVVSVGATFDASFTYAPAEAGTNPAITFNQVGGSFYADCNHTQSVAVDGIVCFSNRSLCMDFVAPGYRITSVMMGSTSSSLSSYGTSASAAHVTGALALLQQVAPGWSREQLLDLLHATAREVPLHPSAPTGARVHRVDVGSAADAVMRNTANDWLVYE